MESLDEDLWEEISSNIEHHLKLGDEKALDKDIRELFYKYEKLHPDMAWQLAKKVYENFKKYTLLKN